MARARNIKPGFYQNEQLAQCSLMARFIFPGLWMQADREGRLEDRPLRLKAALLPYDNADVNVLLDELKNAGLIERYEANGTRFIQVIAFAKHQNPHVREPESTIPAPCKHSAITVPEPDKNDVSTVPARLIPDSLLLIPDSKPSCPISSDESRFDVFWKAYPRKQGKGAAEKAFAKAKLNGHFDSMLTALELQKQSEQWRRDAGQFVPNPATWLNQRRWEDEIPGGSHPDGTSLTNPIFAGME